MDKALLIMTVKLCLDSALFYTLDSEEKAQAVRHTYKLMRKAVETKRYMIGKDQSVIIDTTSRSSEPQPSYEYGSAVST